MRSLLEITNKKMWEGYTDPEERRIAEKAYALFMLIPLIYLVGTVAMFFPADGDAWSPFVHIAGMPFFICCIVAGLGMGSYEKKRDRAARPSDADPSREYRFVSAVVLSYLAFTVLVIWFLLSGRSSSAISGRCVRPDGSTRLNRRDRIPKTVSGGCPGSSGRPSAISRQERLPVIDIPSGDAPNVWV